MFLFATSITKIIYFENILMSAEKVIGMKLNEDIPLSDKETAADVACVRLYL